MFFWSCTIGMINAEEERVVVQRHARLLALMRRTGGLKQFTCAQCGKTTPDGVGAPYEKGRFVETPSVSLDI